MEIDIVGEVKLAADSRYLLTVNGQRIQWGSAPFDPRYQDADSVNIAEFLKPSENVIGAEILCFGHGDTILA